MLKYRKSNDICVKCGLPAPSGICCNLCKAKAIARMSKLRKANRIKVIQHYGGECVYCGEKTIQFLTVDHINGGGTRHRRDILKGSIDPWLIKNNDPNGYQLL